MKKMPKSGNPDPKHIQYSNHDLITQCLAEDKDQPIADATQLPQLKRLNALKWFV